MVHLQDGPIDVAAMTAAIRGDGDGAIALFLGTVRDTNAGRRVLFLEYEAYPEMAQQEMAKIVADARARFPVTSIEVAHRLGRLEIGEVSVAVAVASPHRAAAIDACRFVIDTLKATVPIWKREHFEGGVVWIEGDGSR
ncbi:MAG TPA: molybdenum cofactor biosynthesis protein MoaE [Candidatus Polarisedimenticolaceae bacterium]|nr:molybdenum cofactor biosynthesis protein MoaE [Candidatus Polarisedimenticolaceae bacterium]